MASKSKSSAKSPALKGIAGLVLAGLAWIAHQFGWIDLGEKEGGGAGDDAGGSSVQEQPRDTPPSADRGGERDGGRSDKDKPKASDYLGDGRDRDDGGKGDDTSKSPTGDDGAAKIAQYFKYQRSDQQVRGWGTVRKSLRDDLEGSRHQKFILEMSNGMTLLVAHNIDLAPRVPLEEGDTIHFNGEYEWSDQGGVLHWTHHDPGGRHEGGWLELNGKRYE